MGKHKIQILAGVFLFLSLVFIFSGISYAIFTYFGSGLTNNMIQTGKIIFSYSDADGGGNGIKLENAFPISDDSGKVMTGVNEYFDFSVTATTTTSDLAYEIVANKDANSTLADEFVKVYLTTFEGLEEVETPLTATGIVKTYDELQDTTHSLLKGKTIYYGTVKSGEVAYGRKFRLRMWVKAPANENFDYSLINDKYYSLRVDVAASSTF